MHLTFMAWLFYVEQSGGSWAHSHPINLVWWNDTWLC